MPTPSHHPASVPVNSCPSVAPMAIRARHCLLPLLGPAVGIGRQCRASGFPTSAAFPSLLISDRVFWRALNSRCWQWQEVLVQSFFTCRFPASVFGLLPSPPALLQGRLVSLSPHCLFFRPERMFVSVAQFLALCFSLLKGWGASKLSSSGCCFALS